MPRVPKYPKRAHKSGQARIHLDGRDHYLGPFGSPESHHRFQELVTRSAARRAIGIPRMTVKELVILYKAHAREYYVKDGKPTSEVSLIHQALRPLVELFHARELADFGPRDLKAVRQKFVDAGCARSTCNVSTQRVVRCFRWAVSEEYCPPTVLTALESVGGLRKGRTPAREPEPVGPVDEDTVNATLRQLPGVLRDMVRLQLLSGARPGEICPVRPCDVNRDGAVWEYKPVTHKNAHRGKPRRIFFGPRAQAILGPYLDNRPADAFCFSPREADPRKFLHAGATRKPQTRYSPDSYRNAVNRAADAAGVERWSPNQLRHAAATIIRKHAGLEAAQTVLGHHRADVTQIYAERNDDKAIEAMAELG